MSKNEKVASNIHFNSTFKLVAVGSSTKIKNVQQATSDDDHNKLYTWNTKDNSVDCVWINSKTNTIQSRNYTHSTSHKPRAKNFYGNLIYHNHKLFKFGGSDKYVTPSNEFWVFDLDKSKWNKLKLNSNQRPQPRFSHRSNHKIQTICNNFWRKTK